MASATSTRRKKMRLTFADISFNVIDTSILVFAALVVVYPLLYIVGASFSSPTAVLTGRVILWPVEPSLFSYEAVFKNKQIITGYMNSAIYAVGGMTISTVLTLMAAYPLSCKHLYGRKLLMWVFLFTMLFSGGLIPTYLLLRSVGMIGTRWAMVIPNAVAIWLLIITRTFFQTTIPDELHEAAEIDGCSEFKYFVSILIPLSTPIIAVIALNYAVWQWNSYFNALIYLTDARMYPLQIILRNILILNQVDINMMQDLEDALRRQGLAVALKYPLIVVASAPLLMVYPFAQKYFVKGIMVGSLKG